MRYKYIPKDQPVEPTKRVSLPVSMLCIVSLQYLAYRRGLGR